MKVYTQTKDPKWLKWLNKVHDYIQNYISDFSDLRLGEASSFGSKGGEWFGYLNPDGSIFNACKGGNYKGFFHVPRALLFSSRYLLQNINIPNFTFF